MSSSSKSSGNFDSALEELLQKLGIVVGVRPVFLQKIKDPAIEIDLFLLVSEFGYWKYLKNLLICVHKCSINADKVVLNWGSLMIKIEDLFQESSKVIRKVCANNNIYRNPEDALHVLRTIEKKIGLCKLETGEALNCLSKGCPELKWNLNFLACSLCTEFLRTISQILGHIGRDECQGSEFLRTISQILGHIGRDECQGSETLIQDERQRLRYFVDDKIEPLVNFLDSALKDVESCGFPSNGMIDNFFTHIAFVGLSIANHSFHYWTNKMVNPVMARSWINGLLKLQREINPFTPKFIELILKFLRELNKISNGFQAKHLVSSFLCYIYQDFFIYNEFREKLEPLIIFVITESEEPSEDFMAEVRAMLILLGFSSRRMQRVHLSPFELRARICLLNVEIFLEQLLNSKIISLVDEVEKLNDLMMYLRSFAHRTHQEIEDGKQTLVLLEDVARELVSLYQSFREKKVKEDKVRNSISILLIRVLIFKAKYCLELLNGNPSLMGLGKDQTETLLRGLRLFAVFVTNQQEEMTKEMKPIIRHIQAFARGITSLCYSFIVSKISGEMIKKTILSFSDLLDNMALTKMELKELCPPFPMSNNFPKTHGIGFLDFLLENISELLKRGSVSSALVKHQIERIHVDLESLRSFFKKSDTEDLELKDIGTHVTDVAYRVEYVIDSIEVGIGEHLQHSLWLYDLLEDIRLIKIQATEISTEKNWDARAHNVTQISSSMMISRVVTPETSELMVCLREDEAVLIDRLTRGSSQRDIVSIVGMPGIGKTTLAKKVYNDPKVAYHFIVRAWCSVSQVHAKRELILDILSDIIGLTDNIYQMADEDLDLVLYQALKQKRYLIVLDDVWDNGAWNALETSFPNDGNGSRILMTSRLRDVSLKAKPDSEPHSLRLLSDDESWQLLQMKIFHGSCPEELLEVGKQIANACKGLPLAIVAIAGLLERTEKKQDRWKRIAESVSSQIIDDPQSQCMEILQLSYNHLPDHLKSCFLYFGALLEDKDVPVAKLIRLWIAEGFIQKCALKSSEDLAEDYLIDLIGRSLISVSKKGSRGSVKACRIHDLLRDLCLSKAKEANFLQLITGNDEPYASFSELDMGADFYDYYPSNPVTYEMHRLCFYLKRKHFVKSSPYGPCTRSMIFFAISDTYPRRPYDISFIPRHFKLLRVLDLEDINMGVSFPAGIELLVHLRYLAVSGDIDFVPPSIANLQKLETLILKGLKGKVLLPFSIWSIARLRHIHVNDHIVFDLRDDDKLGGSLWLENLVSFSSPLLTHGKDTEKIMRRFPNLRKLRCIFLESWSPSGNYNQFPELHFLTQLESLKIFYFGRFLNPGDFSLPKNLKKLTLSNFRLPWTHISAVGKLPNLEVLKLISRAFEGPSWDMTEGEFLKLKYLKLDTLNIAQWNASSDHLPNLQQLVLRNCEALEEVPYTLGEISTLLKIEVQSCGRSSEESVRNIMEQEIEGLEIIINQKIHI